MPVTGNIEQNQTVFSGQAAAASGIVARRCVTTAAGLQKLPAATPELTFAGVAQDVPNAYYEFPMQIEGMVVVESDGTGTIAVGDAIIIGGLSDGRVKTKALADGATIYQLIGTAYSAAAATLGAQVSVFLRPQITPLT